MSEREMQRAAVLAQVESGDWTVRGAAERMELRYRQGKRLWRRYRKQGAAGPAHGSAGQAWNRAMPKKRRAQVLRLIRQKYAGEPGERFGPRQKEVLQGTPALTQFGRMCERQWRKSLRPPPAPLPDHPWRKTYPDTKAWEPAGTAARSGWFSVASPSAAP
jgi:hypothetical protein